MNKKKFLYKLIESEVRNVLEEMFLPESSYSKLMQSIAGLEPGINTIGIVTAEKPMAKPLPPSENKMRNKLLAKDIRELGYGFYQIGGKYGSYENPYVIPNVSYKDITTLGKIYKQESVIFVEKQEGKGMLARLIYTGKEEPEKRSKVVLPLQKNVEDFYSIFKGRKFVIPFFDDFFKDMELKGGKLQKK